MPIFNSKVEQFLDETGSPIVNGKVYFGVYGQDPRTEPITIFNNELLTQMLTQPQRTDEYGRLEFDVHIGVDFSFEVRSSDDVLIHGAYNRRLSARTNVGVADGVAKLYATEKNFNVYELDEGFAAAPPSDTVYYIIFNSASTDHPQINFANLLGEYPSVGVKNVRAGILYHVCFRGNSWHIIDDNPSEFQDLVISGGELASCYTDSERPTSNEIFQGKLGVRFTGSSSVQPMGYGVFVPQVNVVYNVLATFQATDDISDAVSERQKNITCRFVDSRPESGDGIIGTVTKLNVSIPNDTDEFQVIFESVLDEGQIIDTVEGRWEIEVENGSAFNYTGGLFMSRVEFQEKRV